MRNTQSIFQIITLQFYFSEVLIEPTLNPQHIFLINKTFALLSLMKEVEGSWKLTQVEQYLTRTMRLE